MRSNGPIFSLIITTINGSNCFHVSFYVSCLKVSDINVELPTIVSYNLSVFSYFKKILFHLEIYLIINTHFSNPWLYYQYKDKHIPFSGVYHVEEMEESWGKFSPVLGAGPGSPWMSHGWRSSPVVIVTAVFRTFWSVFFTLFRSTSVS